MLKRMSVYLLFLSLLLCLPALAEAQDNNRIVAVVGNDIITQYDLEKATNRLQSQILSNTPPNQARPSAQEIRKAALDNLIETLIFKQIVEREKLNLSEVELDRQVSAIMAKGHISEQELAAELSLRGMTMEEYRQELRQDILKRRLIERLVRSRVVISDEQVLAYYNANAGQLAPNRMHLRAIFLPLPADKNGQEQMRLLAQKIHQQLKEGADFSKLATDFSRGPGSDQGGDLGKIEIEDMLPSMRAAVEKLKPGEISKPVALPDNYVIFQRVVEQAAQRGVTAGPTESERQQIRALLEKQALDKRFKQWLEQVRSEVYIKVIEN